jgi:hypothetical protein
MVEFKLSDPLQIYVQIIDGRIQVDYFSGKSKTHGYDFNTWNHNCVVIFILKRGQNIKAQKGKNKRKVLVPL